MKKETQNTSLRLTPEAKRLLHLLAAKLGVSMTAVMEMAIRYFAHKEGVE
jgi:predicted transcriptional regulator